MNPEDRVRLGHMLEAVRDAQGFMDLDIVWKTMREDLPPLAASLEADHCWRGWGMSTKALSDSPRRITPRHARRQYRPRQWRQSRLRR